MTEEWGKWHSHNGIGCPVPDGTYVKVLFSDGVILEGMVDHPGPIFLNDGQWDWQFCSGTILALIVEYCIRKPKGMKVLEEIIEEVDDFIDAEMALEKGELIEYFD